MCPPPPAARPCRLRCWRVHRQTQLLRRVDALRASTTCTCSATHSVRGLTAGSTQVRRTSGLRRSACSSVSVTVPLPPLLPLLAYAPTPVVLTSDCVLTLAEAPLSACPPPAASLAITLGPLCMRPCMRCCWVCRMQAAVHCTASWRCCCITAWMWGCCMARLRAACRQQAAGQVRLRAIRSDGS